MLKKIEYIDDAVNEVPLTSPVRSNIVVLF